MRLVGLFECRQKNFKMSAILPNVYDDCENLFNAQAAQHLSSSVFLMDGSFFVLCFSIFFYVDGFSHVCELSMTADESTSIL